MAATVPLPIEPLLRSADVIQILSISRSQLYDLIRLGVLPPPIKLGGCSRWKAEDIRAAIA